MALHFKQNVMWRWMPDVEPFTTLHQAADGSSTYSAEQQRPTLAVSPLSVLPSPAASSDISFDEEKWYLKIFVATQAFMAGDL